MSADPASRAGWGVEARVRCVRLSVLLWALALSGCSDPPPRHAVLIVIDTLRADMLESADTPSLDALAAGGDRPRVAWSSGTWTAPSVISLFTGQHVRGHGWDEAWGAPRGLPPLPEIPTLAEVLAEQGFATTGIFANPVLSWGIGFRRGFARWERQPDAEVPASVARELERWDDGGRHFLYVHLMGPHATLAPSLAARRRWGLEGEDAARVFSLKWVRRQRARGGGDQATRLYRKAYQAVIEDTDVRVGQILQALGPFRDETVVVVTSDHGEMLGEHGRFGHAAGLDEPLTRVPLIAANTGPLPERMTIAAVPDLISGALGLARAWAVRVGDPGPLVSQRQGKFALSPDGKAKGVWLRNGRLSIVDLVGYPDEEPGSLDREAELRAARARFEANVAPGRTDRERILPEAETLDALRELGYLDE